ncbi:MAG: phage major capsid protein [Chloroflexi bacterium]|nr:phage major capsid protein [Chloroflexota bacterium]
MDNALKTIFKTDDQLITENYIVLFGGRDLEGVASPKKNADGTNGQYFTKTTALASNYTDTGALYVDWEHGDAPDGEPQRDDVLGTVDWKTARIDEKGVFVQRVLNRRNQYMQYLEELIDAGLIGNSSEAIPEGVEIGANGEIKAWPLKRDTLTVSPMEPRMMQENVMQAAKALGLLTGPEPETKPEVSNDGDVVTATIDNWQDSTHTDTEVITMPEEQVITTQSPPDVDAIVAAAATKAADAAVKAYQKFLEDQPPKIDKLITQHDNREEAPFKSLGDFLHTVAHNERDERLRPLKSTDAADEGGFNFTAVAGGDKVGTLYGAQQKRAAIKAISGMSELVPADGGLLVGTDYSQTIMERVYSTGQLLQRVMMLPISGGSNSMSIPKVSETSRANGSRLGGVQAYWASEGKEKTGSKPKFETANLKLNKVIGLVYATDELLDDASALSAWIMSRLPDELRFVVENSIINGTGGGQPVGILNSGAVISQDAVVGQTAATIVSQNVINMYSRRWGNPGDYIWLTSQSSEPQLMQMSLAVGTGGQLTYMPPGGMSGSPYGNIFGRPVVPVEYCPAVGTVGDLMFVNPREYVMIEKGGIQSASSIHVRFIYDEQVFRFVWRVDGQPLWSSALTPFNGGDTQSPYVALATRS